MKQLLFTTLLVVQASAGTISTYTVDVETPRLDLDSIGISGNTGIGRPLLSGVSAVACQEDQTGIGDADYNDFCVYAPAEGALVFLGGLSSSFDQEGAERFSGQVLFTSPQGQWLSGTEHVWVGYVSSPHGPDVPEPRTWGLVLAAAVIGLWKWRKANAR